MAKVERMNRGFRYLDRVPASAAGTTVLDFYAVRHPHFDRAGWLAVLEAGQVSRGGRTVGPSDVLAAGDVLAYDRPPWEEPDVPTAFDVLFDDAAVLVLGKPAGLPVLPGAGCQERTLLFLARERFGDAVAPVHRIDRGTSGAVVLARTPEAARSLARAFVERRVDKRYLALVEGADLPDAFVVDHPIGPVPYPEAADGRGTSPDGAARLGIRTVSGASPDGRPARSRVRVLSRSGDRAVVEVVIETGRPQQVRIHLALAGHPLAGDPVYGPGGLPRPVRHGATTGDTGFLLHAWKVAFPHPGDGRTIEITAPPPPALDV